MSIKRYYLLSYNINSLFILLMLSKKVNIIINKIYIEVSQNLVSLHTYYIFFPRQRLNKSRHFQGFFKQFLFHFFNVVAGQEPIKAITRLAVRYGSKRAINHHLQGYRWSAEP
jgi:hypothetical protein